LNVTAKAASNSTIVVEWEIVKIHDRLKARELTIEYCEMNTSCNPCRYKNITNITEKYEDLNDLRGFTTYHIRAKATNIVAKDGTEVTTPYGNYSNSSSVKTQEGGEEYAL